jgi:tetratricopeptide (TPR) repeat protein
MTQDTGSSLRITYLDQGDLDQAIADYNESLRSERDVDDARYNRGLAWNRKGDFDRAVADLATPSGSTPAMPPSMASASGSCRAGATPSEPSPTGQGDPAGAGRLAVSVAMPACSNQVASCLYCGGGGGPLS